MSDQTDSYDIVIVGGGFGGLQSAISAAERGHKVLVLEKEKEIGYPVRTSGASYVDEMERFQIPDTLYHRLGRCLFVSPNDFAEFVDPKERVCILNVRGVLQYLATLAAEKGADIMLSTPAKRTIMEQGRVIGCSAIRFNKDISLKCKVLIDASGFTRFMGFQQQKDLDVAQYRWKRFGLGAEYEAYVENLLEDTAMLIVGSDVAPTGYAWVFPTGKNRARIGVGVTKPESSSSPLDFLDRMLVKRPKVMNDFGRIVPLELHAGSVPVADVPEKIIGDGWMAIGDAACQPNPIVGEGIRQALYFGQQASIVASEAIKKGDVSGSSFRQYEEIWSDSYSRKYAVGRTIQKKISGYTDADWDDSIKTFKILDTEEFFSFLRSDFSKKFVFSFIARHPRLAANSIVKIVTGAF